MDKLKAALVKAAKVLRTASMARPRKGEERNATAQIAARIPETLRARLDALVKQRQSDLTAEVTEALETHVSTKGRKERK